MDAPADWKEMPGSMPDFCQTMSSLERVLKAYEQAGRALPLQYQCQPALQPVAILIAI